MVDKKSLRYERLKKILLDNKRKMWIDLRQEYFETLGKEYRDQFDNPQDINPQDMEDLSLIDLIEDTGLAVADIRRGELTQMDEALDRLEDGTYGLCANCGQEIDGQRLKVMPFAVYCVSCQREKEIR
jgi:DnaK suppressor protein